MANERRNWSLSRPDQRPHPEESGFLSGFSWTAWRPCLRVTAPTKANALPQQVLVRTSNGPVIIVAKNEGCDEKDKGLAKALVQWLQQIGGSSTTVEKEYQVWKKILKHNKPIINHYLKSLPLSLYDETLTNPSNQQFLQNYTEMFDVGSTAKLLKAHELRQTFSGRNPLVDIRQQMVNLLGTYRAALLTFKLYAEENHSFTNLRIECLPKQLPGLSPTLGELDSTVRSIAHEFGLERLRCLRDPSPTEVGEKDRSAKRP
jgi:hypothetical protein